MKLKIKQREEYIKRLSVIIAKAMEHDADLRMDAIIEGRIGLKEMDDEELVDFGIDVWNLPL
jgi:uncharacterized protein YjiS (DUF1127 family)